MELNGTDFETALLMAQKKGYAEQNPDVDISGIDSQRKIAILGSIAMNGAYINPDSIHTEGIADIDSLDICYAKAMKSKIKLLVVFKNTDDMSAEVIVAPHLIADNNPICVADGVFNAIVVHGNALGDAMFYGKGAGKLATASAVVGDILDGALHKGRNAHITPWHYAKNEVLSSFEKRNVAVLIRVSAETGIDTVRRAFPNTSVRLTSFAVENEAVFEVGRDGNMTEGFLANAICTLPGFISRIRIYS
jgi:homoserine dehydrogenase